MTQPVEAPRFSIAPGPYLWRGRSISQIMYLVVIALLFPTTAAVYFFGLRALELIAVSVASAVITEFLVRKLRGKPFYMDGSAVITGLLLALTLPPTLPLWMAAVGSVFAIAIVKEAFGGLGHNIFNPALAARAFMAASFSIRMTTWVLPMGFGADAVTTATPLGESFAWQGSKLALYWQMFIGNRGGSLGETSIMLILAGAILLFAFDIIDWRIPLTYIGTVALLALTLRQDIIFQLLAGGLMLGAFFMATDYVTSPITPRGQIIFGVGCGAITMLVRAFGGMPEGVTYAILLMNAVTPLIDRYVKPRPYGLMKKEKKG